VTVVGFQEHHDCDLSVLMELVFNFTSCVFWGYVLVCVHLICTVEHHCFLHRKVSLIWLFTGSETARS
jgi:hypothetical protein